MSFSENPPYRIHTRRLVVRCWSPADAPLLKAAIDESLAELRPWMPWAKHEPGDLESKVQLLRKWRAAFDLNQDFVYGIFSPDEAQALGSTGLHTRAGEGALEIGYWVRTSQAGRGLATEASAALTKVAFEVHGVDRVQIHCDPANERSTSVARKLGFTHEATLRRRGVTSDSTRRDLMLWTMFRDEYSRSALPEAEVEAFDVMGRRLL